jgi:hypothetical protein
VLVGSGVGALVFALGVELPVGVEVAVVGEGVQPEDGFGAGRATVNSGGAEVVPDQMPAGDLDRAGVLTRVASVRLGSHSPTSRGKTSQYTGRSIRWHAGGASLRSPTRT